jgi:hypothetical protein
MAQERLPKVPDWQSALPYRVSVSVTHVPADRARRLRVMWTRLAKAPRSLRVVLPLAAVMLVAVVAILIARNQTGPASGPAGAAQRADTAAVAAAFGYPQRCLSIAVSAADPDYASAHVDRTGRCTTYHGYVNASFHRADGVWRLILDEGQLFVPNSLLTPARAGPADARSDYPLGCLSVAITLHDPRFARADFDRRLPCARLGLRDP